MLFYRQAAALLAVGTAVVNAARNITVYNNDTSVAYTGTNCGGSKYTYSTGQFFSFSFVGTAVYLIGTQSTEGGLIGINLDGVAQPNVDRYALPPYRCGVGLWSKSGLSNQTHTVTATLLGNSPANSTTAGFFEWQWLQYTQLDASDLTSSVSSGTAASQTSSSAAATGTSEPKKSSNGAAIGGGIGGGIVALAIAGFLIWWFCIRKSNKRSAVRADLGGDGPYGGTNAYGPNNVGAQPAMAQQNYRNSMSGGVPGATAWAPDAFSAASLAPSGQQPHPQFPAGAAGPMPLRLDSQQTGYYTPGQASPAGGAAVPLLSNYTGSGPQPAPTSISDSRTNNSTSLYTSNPSDQQAMSPYPTKMSPGHPMHSPGIGPGSSVSAAGGGSGTMADSDVDRIAARVASMMQPAPQPVSSNQDYDMPPPVYNEKH